MNKNNILTLIKNSDFPTTPYNATIIIALSPSLVARILSIDKIRKILKKLLTRPKLILKNHELNILKKTNINSKNISRSLSLLDKNKMVHLIHDFHPHDINNINDDIENINIDQYINKINNNLDLTNFKFTHLIFHYSIM